MAMTLESSNIFFILFYVGNVFVLIGSILLICSGIHIVASTPNDDYGGIIEHDTKGIGALVIITGIAVLILALIGFCGAYHIHRCVIIVYCTALIITFTLEVAAGFLCMFYKEHKSLHDESVLRQKLEHYYDREGQEKFTESMNKLQEKLKCCGAGNYTDYVHFSWHLKTKNPMEIAPQSCCLEKQVGCNHRSPYDAHRPEQLYSLHRRGCSECIKEWLGDSLRTAGIIIFIVFFFQWLGILGGCGLLFDIDRFPADERSCQVY